MDGVLALKLNFWPQECQSFLKRIKMNRPQLYEIIIVNPNVYAVSKSSNKYSSDTIESQLEFRLSFSKIELKLAELRTKEEKILNGIARTIFHKYLHKNLIIDQQYLQSYFIKTTVLWMCEKYCFKYMSKKQIAEKWINFTCHLLEKKYCKHYFIKNLNLLNIYSNELLKQAISILKNDVDFYSIHHNKIQSSITGLDGLFDVAPETIVKEDYFYAALDYIGNIVLHFTRWLYLLEFHSYKVQLI
ncbi:unnamed protein product [Didymodactylos carnosus]|uniref:Mab-21-like HhH/H2TH-like domain-containing protein n=2 Tax=Didymodactylos carnosus TaxID=1234261 RepID=A0A8S2UJ16_9BILA|nr:unnamed protein product [Didymodactylos carnosus]CAF4347722.1 unnamed protein product [Didymodactylos carnosus]